MGGLRYHIGIPKVSLGIFNVSMTRVPTTSGGGNMNGIYVIGNPTHGL
jgi:hypothetical protein